MCVRVDYLAPEVILGRGHGKEVDWWALGVIIYEFLTGIPPFNAETQEEIFENIVSLSTCMNHVGRLNWIGLDWMIMMVYLGVADIFWPDIPEEMSPEAQDLISKLLTLDPNERLGAKGADEVKAHPFFAGVDWNTVLLQPAIFVPRVANDTDSSYFDDGTYLRHSSTSR